MMGAMETNIADAFKTGMNMDGYHKMNDLYKATQAPVCELDSVADLCVSLTFAKGAGLVNGACISVDRGWSGILGIS